MKLIILILLFVESFSMSSIFLRKNYKDYKKMDRKVTSLVNLLLHIKKHYFEDHPVFVKYDSSFEKNLPIDFNYLLKEFSGSFVQKQVDLASSDKFQGFKSTNFNYIIFVEKVSSVKDLMEPDSKSKIIIITLDTSWIIKAFLRSHLSTLYANILILTHSLSQRADETTFLLYTHKLYSDGSGSSEPILLTSWKSNSLTQPKKSLFPRKLSDGFKGHRVIVSTAHKPPFTMRSTIPGTDDTTWDGIDIRVLRLLGNKLDFIPEFRDPLSSNKRYLQINAKTRMEQMKEKTILQFKLVEKFGMPTKTIFLKISNEIEAVMNDISKEDLVAAAVGGIYQTPHLVSHFDVSFPYMEDCASFIALSSTALPKYRAVLGPFSESVWLALCAVYITAIIPLTLNSNYSLLSLIKHPSRLNHMFWFVFSTFTNAFSLKNPLLNSGLGKKPTSILIGIYWVFTIIITTCYTGSIIAFITIPVYPPAMESATHLLKKQYKIGTLDRDGWETLITSENMDDPIAKELLKSVEFVPKISDGVKNASRAFFWPYAFLGSRTSLEYFLQAELAQNLENKRSLMHVSDECFLRFRVTCIFKPQSLYTEQFNNVILRAKQSGFINKIQRDVEWDVQRSSTGKFLQVIKGFSFSRQIEEKQLSLDDTQGMFLVLGSGFLIAIFSFLIEYTYHLIIKCVGENPGIEAAENTNEIKCSILKSDVIFPNRYISARQSI